MPRIAARRRGMTIIMWISFAIASAFFAGVTSILAKCGIKESYDRLDTDRRGYAGHDFVEALVCKLLISNKKDCTPNVLAHVTG